MRMTYSKPVAEIEEFALVDVLTASGLGNENLPGGWDEPASGNENTGGADNWD